MSPRRLRLCPGSCRSRFAGSCRSPFLAIHDAVRRTRRRRRHQHRLLKPRTPPAGSGLKASSTETNGATCQQGEGAQNMRQALGLEELPENANTPMLPSKLPHLKNLKISLLKPCLSSNYDVFSLVSFLDASPALESFILRVAENAMVHDPVVGDDTEYRRKNLDFRNDSLRKVMITGFCSAKSLVELTIHILETTHSLERFTLDTTRGYDRMTCNIGKFPTERMVGECWSLSKRGLEEAHRAVETADRYIKGRVPSSVQFEVLGPCPRCHIGE